MPTNINLQNDLAVNLSLATSVSPSLSSSDWQITSNSAIGGQQTQVLWFDRDEGITDGHTWIFTTAFTVAGVAVQLQESLTGTAFSSDLAVQIVAGTKQSGWSPNDTSLIFPGNDGNTYQVNATYFLNGTYDDVTYTLLQL